MTLEQAERLADLVEKRDRLIKAGDYTTSLGSDLMTAARVIEDEIRNILKQT